MQKNKINALLESSKQIIHDCCMKNGAIVAANSTKPYYPKQANFYKYVWPRDAAYTCIAAEILGIEVQEKFFRWCMKAEGWKKTGLFYKNYYINGKKKLRHFQPDQTGSVLMALWHHYKDNKEASKEFEELITRSANGLCNIWKKDHFSLVTEDLWEERHCFPDMKENFTYSLAACSRGLLCANELIPNKRWKRIGNEMRDALFKNCKHSFFRSFGKISDKRTDASLLGLVWPFRLVDANDKRMINTIRNIEDKIVKKSGIYRYEDDEYDGWMHEKHTYRNKGAGYWPLLNFWMAIYLMEKKDKKKALKYYNKVLNDIKGSRFIPEQIFDNKIQIGVSPLCWSHSMFVIASGYLGYI